MQGCALASASLRKRLRSSPHAAARAVLCPRHPLGAAAPVPPGLLQALGPSVEEHLHLLLPALVRLISPSVSVTPLDIRRAVLRSMKRLLPRMQLAGYASAILHPLIKVGTRPGHGAGCAGGPAGVHSDTMQTNPHCVILPLLTCDTGAMRTFHAHHRQMAVQVIGEGAPEELRRDALDTICACALALGGDFTIFVPSIHKAVAK